jgi:hypothetical protein
MSRRGHAAFLAAAAAAALLGAILWGRWGQGVWLAGLAGWCG